MRAWVDGWVGGRMGVWVEGGVCVRAWVGGGLGVGVQAVCLHFPYTWRFFGRKNKTKPRQSNHSLNQSFAFR